MSSTGTEVSRKLVADALRLNWAGIEGRFAVRCTAGVALPLVLSIVAGQPLAGASAAYGALITGLISRQGVYRTRVGGMLAASVVLGISALAGALTGPYTVLNIALLAVWCLVFGIVGSLGRSATAIAVNACVGYVVFSNAPYDQANPAFQASMVVAGGLLQMLLLVMVWPLTPFRAERATLAAAYAKLAQYATGLRADDLGLPDSESLSAVSAALADPQPFGGRTPLAAYQALADEAERVRATLAALATEQHLLEDVGLTTAAAAVRDVGHAAGPLLEEVAAAVAAGRAPERLDPQRHALDEAVRTLERSSQSGPYVDDARALAGQVRSALRSALAAVNGGLAVEAERPRVVRLDVAIVRRMLDRLLANCSWGSSYARHAVRLAVTMSIAVIAQHLLSLEHAQWIGLTVVLVLRPDFSTTFTRGIQRVAGTVGGAVVASLIAVFHPSAAAYTVLAIAFAGLAFALFNVSYALFSLAITGYIVYLLAFGGAPEHRAALDRVVATVIGGLLALLAYAAWPAWTHTRVGDDLADLIDAQRRYIVPLLLGFARTGIADEAALRSAQTAVWRARSNAQASVDRMAGEPVRPRGISLRNAAGVLAASRRLGIAGLTLHARVQRISDQPHELIERLAGDLDVALLAIVDALRSGEPPRALPPLRADQIALKRALDEQGDPAVEVLISETDLIVDSVNTLAAITARLEPTLA